jgi:hypothetical protein
MSVSERAVTDLYARLTHAISFVRTLLARLQLSNAGFPHPIKGLENAPSEKKASTSPAFELPERLALNSSLRFPFRWNVRVPWLASDDATQAVSNDGEACYAPRNITGRKSVKTYFSLRIN